MMRRAARSTVKKMPQPRLPEYRPLRARVLTPSLEIDRRIRQHEHLARISNARMRQARSESGFPEAMVMLFGGPVEPVNPSKLN